ncbi:MAG TPA: hypothetical protein VEV15_13840 [Flavisolibacter sp.]|nr:hypothetical protein [Flavisolibacter sp.]
MLHFPIAKDDVFLFPTPVILIENTHLSGIVATTNKKPRGERS